MPASKSAANAPSAVFMMTPSSCSPHSLNSGSSLFDPYLLRYRTFSSPRLRLCVRDWPCAEPARWLRAGYGSHVGTDPFASCLHKESLARPYLAALPYWGWLGRGMCTALSQVRYRRRPAPSQPECRSPPPPTPPPPAPPHRPVPHCFFRCHRSRRASRQGAILPVRSSRHVPPLLVRDR
jgi:hypothetical protein